MSSNDEPYLVDMPDIHTDTDNNESTEVNSEKRVSGSNVFTIVSGSEMAGDPNESLNENHDVNSVGNNSNDFQESFNGTLGEPKRNNKAPLVPIFKFVQTAPNSNTYTLLRYFDSKPHSEGSMANETSTNEKFPQSRELMDSWGSMPGQVEVLHNRKQTIVDLPLNVVLVNPTLITTFSKNGDKKQITKNKRCASKIRLQPRQTTAKHPEALKMVTLEVRSRLRARKPTKPAVEVLKKKRKPAKIPKIDKSAKVIVNPPTTEVRRKPADDTRKTEQASLLNDIKKAKKANQKITCSYCAKEVNWFSYKRHYTRHQCSLSHECDECDKKFRYVQELTKHKNSHLAVKPFKCDTCDKRFVSQYTKKIHDVKFHSQSDGVFKCSTCGKEFGHLIQLRGHERWHEHKRDYICDFCGKVYKQETTLGRHRRLEHLKELSNKDKKLQCQVCGVVCISTFTYQNHSRIHTGELPFECDLCDRKFRMKEQLHKHKRYHTGEKPYKCQLCDKSFSNKGQFEFHNDRHHLKVPRHNCKYCPQGRKFFSYGNMLKHIRRTHLNLKRFQCDLCEKAFCERQELRNHLKVHEKANKRYNEQNKPDCMFMNTNEPELITMQCNPNATIISPIIDNVPNFFNMENVQNI